MEQFTVSNKTLSAIRVFLVNKPYREVADIVKLLDDEIVPQLNQKEGSNESKD